jgi:hypothetical protein
MADRAKRLSKSQKHGQLGQIAFEKWAVENGLNPFKPSVDLGIDYMCQGLKPVHALAEELTGGVLLCQVRATDQTRRPQVTLTRDDATTALRSEAPYCLIGVALKPSERIYFRFLDSMFFEELVQFLKSGDKYFYQRLNQMQDGSDIFKKAFQSVSKPAFRYQLEERKAEADLQAILPSAKLKVIGGPEGLKLVTVPMLPSIFRLENQTQRDSATRTFFTPQPFATVFESARRQFDLHAPFKTIEDLASGPLVVLGATEAEVTLTVEWHGQHAESQFLVRHVEDEHAYIGSSGLILHFTSRRKDEKTGEHYHGFRGALEASGALDLVGSGQLEFLKLLRPGAHVGMGTGQGLEFDRFGFGDLGRAIEALERVFQVLNIPLTEVKLFDFADSHFGEKIGFLDALLSQSSTLPLIPSFVIGLPETASIDEESWQRCNYRVPIVLNLKGRGIVVWVGGEAEKYIHEGLIQGFRFTTANFLSAETHHPEYPRVSTIEAWIFKDWPPIPLTNRDQITVKLLKQGPLPLEGEFSPAVEDN